MIGAESTEIIRLHLSFRLSNFSIHPFTDSVVTKVSGNQRLDVIIYYATIEITWNLNISYYQQLPYYVTIME